MLLVYMKWVFFFFTFPALISGNRLLLCSFQSVLLAFYNKEIYMQILSCQFYKDLIQSAQDLNTKQERPGDNSVLQWSDQRPDLNPTDHHPPRQSLTDLKIYPNLKSFSGSE